MWTATLRANIGRTLTLKICTTLLIVVSCTLSGCAWLQPARNSAEPPRQTQGSLTPQITEPSVAEFDSSPANNSFSKSEFIADDFLGVVLRVPQFVPGQTRFSASLPKTRYGEILLERLRTAGFTIVLGPAGDSPKLNYSIELPTEDAQNLHTFFLSVGDVHLKRSYEIVGDRIAPVTAMLMAGIDATTLRPVEAVPANNSIPAFTAEPGINDVVEATPSPTVINNATVAAVPASTASVTPPRDVKVPQLNQLLSSDSEWNPLAPNMYESLTSVYEPMFEDSTVQYDEVSMQILVFPNDSLVLGNLNKSYLFDLANRILPSTDVVRVIGCSHGKTQLVDGNQNLARGRAVRVREELMLAGVNGANILHEACWANQHFDEMMPRRGVVVMHLRENSAERS